MASGINIYSKLLISRIRIIDISNWIIDINTYLLISGIQILISNMQCWYREFICWSTIRIVNIKNYNYCDVALLILVTQLLISRIRIP